MDLPLNIDKLVLTGKKDIDAMGGGDNITIIGNRGDNVIIGLGGTNNLMGGAGRDEITGGIDADNFLFKSNADKEIILDFEDGIDRIVFFPTKNIDAVADIQDHLEQHGADVWIRAAGTIMVVRNIEQNQLTDADFDMVST
jgi:Ca2+-binding RTX toxin-like protein